MKWIMKRNPKLLICCLAPPHPATPSLSPIPRETCGFFHMFHSVTNIEIQIENIKIQSELRPQKFKNIGQQFGSQEFHLNKSNRI
jgi:hypothetical protein